MPKKIVCPQWKRCVEHGGIITSCGWLLKANGISYFLSRPCCSSSVPSAIMEVAFAIAFISISTSYKVHGRSLAAMGRHYEFYLCLRIQIYLYGLRTCSKAVQPSTWPALLKATMIVFLSCFAELRTFSALITYGHIRTNTTLGESVDSIGWRWVLMIAYSSSLRTPFSQLECQWRLITSLRVNWGL